MPNATESLRLALEKRARALGLTPDEAAAEAIRIFLAHEVASNFNGGRHAH